MHVPAAIKLTVAVATVQTEVVFEEKVIELPEAPPVAVRAYVVPATLAVVGAVEVMFKV